MKRVTLISILLMLFVNGQAQYGDIFPDRSALWNIYGWNLVSGQNVSGFYWNEFYNSDNDDTIVYINQFDTTGLITIDTVQGKVYYKSLGTYFTGYYPYYDTSWKVLYDFSIVVGDTAYEESSTGVYAVLDSTDTTSLLGVPRKRYFFSNGDVWIHGMGSILDPLRPFLTEFEGGYLVCAFQGEYHPSASSSYQSYDPVCSIGVGEVNTGDKPVYPNPTRDKINIPDHDVGMKYFISDESGRLISTGELSNSRQISLGKFPPGLYFVQLGNRVTKVILTP